MGIFPGDFKFLGDFKFWACGAGAAKSRWQPSRRNLAASNNFESFTVLKAQDISKDPSIVMGAAFEIPG